MRFYIATSFSNSQLMQETAELLKARGWQHTLDWAQLEENKEQDKPGVAKTEINAVITADIVIVILVANKAQRGTHCEIGAALATGKPILLFAEDSKHIEADGYSCVFYKHPKCHVFIQKNLTAVEITDWAMESIGCALRRGVSP